ncbi:MAG TPA: glycoside hydrolase family 11 protein [Polyangiaceae bacterium]|nr:glycoside hydrolase family 11 protein [Polyangiaceae bacterium]
MLCPQTARSFAALSACVAVAFFAGCAGTPAPGTEPASAGTSASGSSTGAGGAPSANTGGSPAGAASVAGSASIAGSASTAGGSGPVAVGGSVGVGGSIGTGGFNSQGGSTVVAGGPPSGGTGNSTGGTSSSGGAAGAVNTCPTVPALTGGTKYCSNSTGNVGSKYSYELWAEGNGSGCMTVFNKDANFSANWSGVEDFLARIGLTFDRTKTPDQIGTLSADFAESKTGNTGLVYVGIYGWTVDPLREYYILDDWGSTKPAGTASDGTPRDSVGTITVDGEVYDVWKKTRTNKPAITGDNMTFDQYFSIRRTARQCGHISISEHFTKWIGLGLKLGKLVESKLLLEAQDSTGTIDFTTATVTAK